jgi:PAS domain S-box-containing protein
VSSLEQEIDTLKRRLSEADELVRAIHDGEVDAFVLRHRDSYKVHALQGADTAYRVLVEGMRQGAATISRDGTILYANGRLCEMLGATRQTIVGCAVTECFGFDRATVDGILLSANQGEAPGEFVIRTGDQSIASVISAYPLEVEGHESIFCLVISDVSDRKAAEKKQAALAEERAELAGIFSKLPFAVFVADPRGGIYYVNEIGEKLAASQGVLDKVRWFASEIKEEVPTEPLEVEVDNDDGSTACYRLYANSVRSPQKAGRAVVVAMDVTHEREARKRRERDDQLRETFVAILGHDLRTPLGTIHTAGDLMKRRAAAAGDTKLADVILRATHRMKGLTDDMLDLASSRLGEGIPLAPVDADLALIVATVTEELSSNEGVDFATDLCGDTRGVWDPGRMTQVLSNLLSNAVSYGAPGKAIDVRVDGGAAEEVTIAVTNQGEPIPVDLLPVLFDPFRRGRGAGTKNKGGIGLGLYIAEQIVTAHGGAIEVRSGREEGTTFKVRLPRAASARARTTH